MTRAAVIFGCEGHTLTGWERDFFRDVDPWGFILFARNVDHPDQLRRLTASLRETVGWDAPILIDQEGGRVQRLGPPHWRSYLPAYDQMQRSSDPVRAFWLRNRLIAQELYDVGIDVNCAPLADIAEPATHPFLRNRLYGEDVETVVTAAQVCAAAHLAGGVLPVLKHMPGHGQAQVDSHKSLPTVRSDRAALAAHEFATFKALNDIRLGMTCHLVFDAIDPINPATTSAKLLKVIRTEIGFDGLIMTDDIGMEALSGSIPARATAALTAGCDLVLQCNGGRAVQEPLAAVIPLMSAAATQRADHALAQCQTPVPIDIRACEAELASLLG
ncbi:beta-N-acetylhexosaminidase [Cognatiyoonia koreensis]|uniref:beta-N-acetylhexosaminidase n=1 Tax=Cognatiyoonia koreensis TaxID=364200 RepID=A0A1I0NWP8_9RHOB|nr:glycoside hydrolase family 3 N-terminal domain-containing protein [Cognatiyoonia koreensis]SEW06185.1 beta-N-acetylhexosaminidase [Cognatiyoonia koreensis]